MLLIANWKQNKNLDEVEAWLKLFDPSLLRQTETIQVVVCPSDPFVLVVDEYFKQNFADLFRKKLFVGVQNISEFIDGAHTGELGANQIKNLAKYAIIGHSERRKMGETNDDVAIKVDLCLKTDILPIVCFSQDDEVAFLKQKIENHGKILFAYEPLSAIGTGNPASEDDINVIFQKINLDSIIYGGSVDADVAKSLRKLEFIGGFLVGGYSLDPQSFSQLIEILSI